jgi:hypothetical protein
MARSVVLWYDYRNNAIFLIEGGEAKMQENTVNLHNRAL